jgi:hypothetical protein
MSIELRCLVSLNINAREQNVLGDILHYALMRCQRNTRKSSMNIQLSKQSNSPTVQTTDNVLKW